jgi:hypothetical protein
MTRRCASQALRLRVHAAADLHPGNLLGIVLVCDQDVQESRLERSVRSLGQLVDLLRAGRPRPAVVGVRLRRRGRRLLPFRQPPEHRVVAGSGEIGDDVFRSYLVIQTPEMLERYERYVAPAAEPDLSQLRALHPDMLTLAAWARGQSSIVGDHAQANDAHGDGAHSGDHARDGSEEA